MTLNQKWFERCYDEQSKGKTLRSILHVRIFSTEVDSIKRISAWNRTDCQRVTFSSAPSNQNQQRQLECWFKARETRKTQTRMVSAVLLIGQLGVTRFLTNHRA